MFYDLTTIYFETSVQRDLCDFGFSKDGKHAHVQIMLVVIVTKEGLPIDYEEFPGNCFEGHTLIPVLEKIKERYEIDNVVLVADAGLMNKINLQELDKREINYVIATRIKHANKEVKQNILDSNHYTIINKNDEDEITAKLIEDPQKNGVMIIYHSSKRARKDEFDRQKDLDRIQKYIGSTGKFKLTTALRKSYVKCSKSGEVKIDTVKLEKEKKYDGYFGLQTNIKDPNPRELLSLYRGLWQIEQTFRISKTNLEIRPVFHYTTKRIKAHFVICYIALALVRYVEFTLKRGNCHIPCDQLHTILNKMRTVSIVTDANIVFEILEDAPPDLTNIYKTLKIIWPKKFSTKALL